MEPMPPHKSEPENRGTRPLAINVKSIVAHLTLRQEPRVVSETLIRYVTPDEVLQVIDEDNPLAKIGVKGQWLYVRTAGGSEGYVAAWFVERV
jgi:hypothetical protein